MKSASEGPSVNVKYEMATKLKQLLNRPNVVTEKADADDDDNKSHFSLETKNSTFSNDNAKKICATKFQISRADNDPTNDINSLSVRIIIGDFIQSIKCKAVKDNIADFDNVLICDGVLPEDPRTVTIQILQEAEGGVSKFIGNIDLPLVDIYDDDTIVEKLFNRQDVQNKSLTIEIEFAQAN